MSEQLQPIVRDAVDADMPAICGLYNALIATTTVAWTETPETLRARGAWFRQQQRANFPVLVAELDDEVVGFCAYGSFRGAGKWPGYRFTVEHTVHVRESVWGAGVGRLLMLELVARARTADMHVMVAAIDGSNVDSIAFHERLDFEIVGRMPETGHKHNRWLDLILMQRIL